MDELLQRLREEGRQDVSGGFTLNPERAREVMSRYQSAAPERYPLMFVAAACRLGARLLSLREESDYVLEGAHLSGREVEDLFCHLLSDGGLRYLGMGMLMAEQLEPAYVRLSCSGTRLTLQKGKTLVEKVPDGPLRLEVRSKRSWFRSGPLPMTPSRVLINWALLAPLAIVIDGAPLERCYRPDEPLLATLVVGNLPVQAPGLVDRLPSPGSYQAALTVGARRGAAGRKVVPEPGQVWCVADGVAYPIHGLLPYWLRGVIVTELARPDLSLTSVVVTEPLRELAGELMELLGGVIEQLAEQGHPEAVDEVRSYAAWRGGTRGIALLNQVLQFPGLSPEERVLTLMQTSAMEWGAGAAQAAEAHLRQALEQITERPRRIEALLRLAAMLQERVADLEERLPVLRELLVLMDKVGRSDGRALEVLEQLAVLTEGEEARKLNVRLLQAKESVLGTNHADLTPVLNRLARLCAGRSALDEEHFRQRSLEIWSYCQGRGCEPPSGL